MGARHIDHAPRIFNRQRVGDRVRKMPVHSANILHLHEIIAQAIGIMRQSRFR